jgi:hypothetical protein
MAERSGLHDLIHEIIDHLDLSPVHRLDLHAQTDDHFDPDGEMTAPAVEATENPDTILMPAPTGKAAEIEALKAQLAEQDQEDEIAALKAQLAARKPPPADPEAMPDEPSASQIGNSSTEGA